MNNNSEIDKYIRPDLINMKGFNFAAHKRPKGNPIQLTSNENPFGCSPKVLQALAKIPYLHRYPDPSQKELRELIGRYLDMSAEYIVAGHGSEEMLDNVLRLFVGQGDEVISCEPGYTPFPIRTQITGGEFIRVPRDANFDIDVSAVLSAITSKTKLIVIANPNNPTGSLTPEKQILELAKSGVPLMVDEAYGEFSGQSVCHLVSKYENLMVLRTFSKWAGQCGMRIGYGIFSPNIAKYQTIIRNPANVSSLATIVVRESLADIDYLMDNVRIIIEEREKLYEELNQLNFLRPVRSYASFIYCPVINTTAQEIQKKLNDKEIRVLAYDISTQPGASALRISIGKPEENKALLIGIREVGKELGLLR